MSSHAAHKLSALFVKKTNKPEKYSDGLGLYLVVEPTRKQTLGTTTHN